MSVRLALGSLIVSALVAQACAGAQPQPFPNLPASTPVVSSNPATATVPESVVTSAPPVTATTTTPATATGSDKPVLVPLTNPTPDVPKPNPARSSASDRIPSKRTDGLLRTALGLRGTRYRLGGESPQEGFDCSGFVRYVFEQNQLEVPRTVADQFQFGEKIEAEEIQKGDLLFFSTTGPGATHVGIALGADSQGEFVHAPGAGGAVRVERFDAPYWRSKLVGVRRVY
jgi:cell wall-associated NlpC family hydrolase